MIKSELMKWYDSLDSERGNVVDIKAFDEESDTVEYAKETLNRRYLAAKGNSKEEILCRYIQQKYGYSEKRSRVMVGQMLPYNDIFEEFLNYACVGKFRKEDKSQIEICGYTAEVLNRDFNLSPLGSYNFLVYLKEEPERAIADLMARLPRK